MTMSSLTQAGFQPQPRSGWFSNPSISIDMKLHSVYTAVGTVSSCVPSTALKSLYHSV